MLRLVPEMLLDFRAARRRIATERLAQEHDVDLSDDDDQEVDAMSVVGGGGEGGRMASSRQTGLRPRDRNYDVLEKRLIEFEEFIRNSCADLLARPSNTLQVLGFESWHFFGHDLLFHVCVHDGIGSVRSPTWRV